MREHFDISPPMWNDGSIMNITLKVLFINLCGHEILRLSKLGVEPEPANSPMRRARLYMRSKIVDLVASYCAGISPVAAVADADSETWRRTAFFGSKAALRELADSLREEEAGYGVRVTTVYPGATATDLLGEGRLPLRAVRSAVAALIVLPQARTVRTDRSPGNAHRRQSMLERSPLQMGPTRHHRAKSSLIPVLCLESYA
ncbi:SDR family NAD(P)-dependent oxidoreductase [Nonomuraea sp. CA-141351]|uniref:SDR family NAD(P)-dependent oxidoreductase n=1 Tax=Nonomuraea sp. CA-141351 TaxID=3239996 RepID=UPI003D8FBCE8